MTLQANQVRKIKELLLQGNSRRAVADLFGMSTEAVAKIARGDTWRKVRVTGDEKLRGVEWWKEVEGLKGHEVEGEGRPRDVVPVSPTDCVEAASSVELLYKKLGMPCPIFEAKDAPTLDDPFQEKD